jgi:hypothetical protein
MCLAGKRQGLTAELLQNAPVGPGRQMGLVVCLLQRGQSDRRHEREDGIPGRLAGAYDLGIGPAGRGTVAPEVVGVPEFPGGGRAEGQVVGVQILQSAARLGNDRLHLMLSGGQRGPDGSNTSDNVSGLVI